MSNELEINVNIILKYWNVFKRFCFKRIDFKCLSNVHVSIYLQFLQRIKNVREISDWYLVFFNLNFVSYELKVLIVLSEILHNCFHSRYFSMIIILYNDSMRQVGIYIFSELFSFVQRYISAVLPADKRMV